MKRLSLLLLVLSPAPALAATGPFLSLHNTNFVVLLAFLLFIAVLFHFKVPGLLGGLLDKRAVGIQSDLDQARALREEAKSLLASYERKHKEMLEQADRIIEASRKEAAAAAEQAKVDLKASIARRLASAEEQIASAEARVIKDVRDQAIAVAVSAARDVLSAGMTPAAANQLLDSAIDEVGAKLH